MAIYLYSEDFADRFNADQGLSDGTLVELNDTTTWMTEFIALFVGNPVEEHDINNADFYNNGYGALQDAITAFAEEELNGMFEFTMEYDSEGTLVNELKEERIIKAKAQDKLGYQLFRIYSITKNHENDNIIVKAQHITYDLANNFVEKMEASNISKKQVMESIGGSTARPHPFNLTSTNSTTISSTSLYRTNPLQMVAGMTGSVLQIWGGQIERDNFDLVMHDRRGHDDGVTVRYKKNITGLEATVDISGLVTRIYPFVHIGATEDEPERLITVSGKYIDSDLINTYSQVYIKEIDYSQDDRINTEDKTDAEIRSQLQSLADNYFKDTGNDKPKVDMNVQFVHLWETEEYKDVAPLELVGMGDTVAVDHSKLNVQASAIVNYIRYDCIAEVNEEVKLGSVKARFSESINRLDRVEKEIDDVRDNANKAIISANGKNTTFYGPDEPDKAKKGDLWFKVVDGEYTRTYRFDGIEWQVIMDMNDKEVEDLVDDAKKVADDAYKQANKAVGDSQKAFDKAQDNSIDIENFAVTLSDDSNVTTLTAIAEGLQTRITNSEDNISELTLTSEVLRSRINSLVSKNLISHDEDDWIELPFVLMTATPIVIKGGYEYTFSSYTNTSYKFTLAFFDNNDDLINNKVYEWNGANSVTFTTPADAVTVKIGVESDGDSYKENLKKEIKIQLEEGSESTEWEDGTSDSLYSQISQLSNAINLRVAKGDVINQINISDEDILISGKKLILDGDTSVRGSFKLDGSANIKDASIGTAQIGTIDAAQASIVNINVNDLVGNYATFISEGFNGIGSQVKISSAGLSTYSGGLRTSLLDGTGHRFYRSGSYVGHIGTSNWVDDTSYRGLRFGLENNANYMTWGYKQTSSTSYYTTMLAWHKGIGKNMPGFTFYDDVYFDRRVYMRGRVNFSESVSFDESVEIKDRLYVTDLMTREYSTNRRAEIQSRTWDGATGFSFVRNGDGGKLWLGTARAALIDSGNAHIEVGNDSNGNYVSSTDITNRHYSSSSNQVRVTINGRLGVTTSSRRFKLQEKVIPLEYAKKLLNVDAKSWYDKSAVEEYADILSGKLNSKDCDSEPISRIPGTIAEDVHEAGLGMFVSYDEEGKPLSLAGNLWTLLIPLTKDHENRLSKVEKNTETMYDKMKNEIENLKVEIIELKEAS